MSQVTQLFFNYFLVVNLRFVSITVPHSPARTEGSVGLVIERKRAGKGFNDGLLWFCDNCNHKLHEVYFELHDIEKDFLPHFSTFYNSEEKRTCKKCGTVMETNPKFTTKK